MSAQQQSQPHQQPQQQTDRAATPHGDRVRVSHLSTSALWNGVGGGKLSIDGWWRDRKGVGSEGKVLGQKQQQQQLDPNSLMPGTVYMQSVASLKPLPQQVRSARPGSGLPKNGGGASTARTGMTQIRRNNAVEPMRRR